MDLVAAGWLARWDAQQQTYMPDREERFGVMLDLVHATAGDTPRILDLGCGPGSLSTRLLRRLPRADVVGVDADPVLLELARRSAPSQISFVDADLRTQDWAARIPAGPYDAIVSTTALHWLPPQTLSVIYRTCAGLLGDGGLLANGDHFREPDVPTLDALSVDLDRRRAERAHHDGERWEPWWEAMLEDPDFADAAAERERRGFASPGHRSEKTLAVHISAMRAAGFGEVGVLWRKGTDAVLVAVR